VNMNALIDKLPEGWMLVYGGGEWTVLDDGGDTVFRCDNAQDMEDNLLVEFALHQSFLAMHMASNTVPAEA